MLHVPEMANTELIYMFQINMTVFSFKNST